MGVTNLVRLAGSINDGIEGESNSHHDGSFMCSRRIDDLLAHSRHPNSGVRARSALRLNNIPELDSVREWLADKKILDPEGPGEMFEAMSNHTPIAGATLVGVVASKHRNR